MKGRFITIDGIDGSGKTTQSRLLLKYLKEKGFDSIVTKEPTEGRIGKLLKDHYLKTDYPLIDAFLFSADREEHLKTEIISSLEKGTMVISDRYYHSTLTYQYTSGVDLSWLIDLNKFFLKPDVVIFIDADPETCIDRMKNRTEVLEKFEHLEFLKKLRKSYLEVIEKLKEGENIIIIDGNRTIQEVHEDIIKITEKII